MTVEPWQDRKQGNSSYAWPTKAIRHPWSNEKIYVALPDADAEKHGLIRIVDESGDDYLYPKALFRSIALPQGVRRAVLAA